jgi:myosin heavy subunit
VLSQDHSLFDVDEYNSDAQNRISNLEEELESTMNLRQELTSRLEQTMSDLEKARSDSQARVAALNEQIESEIQMTADLQSQLDSTRSEIEEAKRRIQEAEQTKDDLFKLLTDTIAELETTKQNAKEMEEQLRAEIAAEIASREEYERLLAEKTEELRLALENWEEERQKLLARIKELEEELASTKTEMRMKLDEAEREKEQALAMSDAELRRLLEEAEREKNQALDKVRLLLSGNQKQGYLFHFENSLVGMVWKKRFFVLRDNLLSWYSKEKRIGGAKPKGVIYCEKSRLYEMSSEEAKREFCFQVDDGNIKHNIAAESMEEMKSWMTEIRVAKKKTLGVQVVSAEKQGPLSPRNSTSSPRAKNSPR